MTPQEWFDYTVSVLVNYIKGGVINPKTGLPFAEGDIKIQSYKDAVHTKLIAQ